MATFIFAIRSQNCHFVILYFYLDPRIRRCSWAQEAFYFSTFLTCHKVKLRFFCDILPLSIIIIKEFHAYLPFLRYIHTNLFRFPRHIYKTHHFGLNLYFWFILFRPHFDLPTTINNCRSGRTVNSLHTTNLDKTNRHTMKVTAVAFTFAALASATLAVPVLSSEQNQGTY